MLGLNKLFGDLLSKDELSKVVAFNYGEEHCNSKNFLVPGFTTLGAFWCALNGGINIVSGDFKLAFHGIFPKNAKCLLGYPRLNKNEIIEFTLEHAEKGFKINTMDVVRHFDRFDAAKKCYWILMDFIPAVKEGNIKKIGEVIWSLEWNTIEKIPLIITRGRFEVFWLLSELYFNGAEITFLTSGGPAVFVASSKLGYKEMEKIFKKYGYETLKVSVDNKGPEVNYI
jgi:predicted sugar kinase